MRNSRGFSIAQYYFENICSISDCMEQVFYTMVMTVKINEICHTQNIPCSTLFILQISKDFQEALSWRQGWGLCDAMFNNNFNHLMLK